MRRWRSGAVAGMDIALAFESGGAPSGCARTLAALRDAGARATIFLDGRWAEAHPELVREIAAAGHELGNHAYSHPDLTALGDLEIAAELERTEALAQSLVSRTTRPWFRPPFQRLDDRVRRIATVQGYRCLSRDALDGAHYLGASTTAAVLERSLARAAHGAVLTYHLHSEATGEAIPEILARLRQAGARVGPLSDLTVPPPERAPLHPDFAGQAVDPGYLRMQQPGPPPQRVNLLALGMDALAPADLATMVGSGGRGVVELLVFNGRAPLRLEGAAPRHVACLAGEVVLQAAEAGAAVCRALARPGDVLEVRRGWTLSLEPRGVRGVLLVVR